LGRGNSLLNKGFNYFSNIYQWSEGIDYRKGMVVEHNNLFYKGEGYLNTSKPGQIQAILLYVISLN
jgi:hypothetical protein